MRNDELEFILESSLATGKLLAGVFSKLRSKTATPYTKVSVRPVELRGTLQYHVTYHYPTKETHENLEPEETQALILRLLGKVFRQGFIYTEEADWQILISKKGVAKILKHPPSRQKIDLSHDRQKTYVLQEGKPIPFLIELGVMNKSGQVYAKRYKKFRQLNKFLEIV